MANEQNEVLEIFTRTRALLSGHFVLRSGMHSGHYFQCAQVCQQMDAVERLAELLLAKVRGAGKPWACSAVITLYSRSTAWADGSKMPGGLRRIT